MWIVKVYSAGDILSGEYDKEIDSSELSYLDLLSYLSDVQLRIYHMMEYLKEKNYNNEHYF